MKPEANDVVVIDDTDEAAGAIANTATDAIVIETEDGEDLGKAELPDRATLNDDGSVTLKLVKPVTLRIKTGSGKERDEVYESLAFHELTGLDIRLASQESDEIKRTIVFLARATRMSVARMNVLFDRLSSRDVKGATDVIAYFQE